MPRPSAFSSPPIRCSRPGGARDRAHGLASVSASRRYGQNSAEPSGAFGSVAKPGSMLGSVVDASGTCHGSEPLASEPSDSRITGVR